jgi:hypothetical protein
MSWSDSCLLREAIARDEFGSIQVEEALRRYFLANKDVIWTDALAENDLI